MRMGVPLISKNCFEGTPFLPGGTIRVPRPAAGMIAITFIKGQKYNNFADELPAGLSARFGWTVRFRSGREGPQLYPGTQTACAGTTGGGRRVWRSRFRCALARSA